VSVNLERWDAMMALTEPFANVYRSVGVHPNEHDGAEPTVEDLVGRSGADRLVAIGETGLDYHYGGEYRQLQLRRFETHLQAAEQTGLPVIVHSRAARDDTIACMRAAGAERFGGVMHCFTEDWDMARRALDLGFYISFSGIVTFRNAAELRQVARRVPAERLLVETDSPWLTPVPHRGKPNHPAMVAHVAECLAELRGETAEGLAASSSENFFRLFPTGAAGG
jgi:TatD DNase family protein